jgi:hypothetical protein
MRDLRLQGVETIVERGQGVPVESDDDRFFLELQFGRSDLQGHARVGSRLSHAPLLNGGRADILMSDQRLWALLVKLDRATDRVRWGGCCRKEPDPKRMPGRKLVDRAANLRDRAPSQGQDRTHLQSFVDACDRNHRRRIMRGTVPCEIIG